MWQVESIERETGRVILAGLWDALADALVQVRFLRSLDGSRYHYHRLRRI